MNQPSISQRSTKRIVETFSSCNLFHHAHSNPVAWFFQNYDEPHRHRETFRVLLRQKRKLNSQKNAVEILKIDFGLENVFTHFLIRRISLFFAEFLGNKMHKK
jgi:hypothetical protein